MNPTTPIGSWATRAAAVGVHHEYGDTVVSLHIEGCSPCRRFRNSVRAAEAKQAARDALIASPAFEKGFAEGWVACMKGVRSDLGRKFPQLIAEQQSIFGPKNRLVALQAAFDYGLSSLDEAIEAEEARLA